MDISYEFSIYADVKDGSSHRIRSLVGFIGTVRTYGLVRAVGGVWSPVHKDGILGKT